MVGMFDACAVGRWSTSPSKDRPDDWLVGDPSTTGWAARWSRSTRPTDCPGAGRGPNLVTSLTNAPEGTLVANAEALVGYADDRYVRVYPATGALTDVGR